MIDSELSGVFPWSHSLGLFISCTFLFLFLGGGGFLHLFELRWRMPAAV